MGCGASGANIDTHREFDGAPVPGKQNKADNEGSFDEFNGCSKPMELKSRKDITTEEMELVRSTWNVVVKNGNIGEELFKTTTRASFDLQELFSTRSVNVARLGARFEEAFTVLIDSVSASLEPHCNKKQALQPLIDIGRKHVNYGIYEYHYSLLWQALQGLLARELREKLDERTKTAWKSFYSHASRVIVMAHRKEQANKSKQSSVTDVAKKSVSNLSPEDMSYIKSTWASLKIIKHESLENLFFPKVFQKCPNLRSLFEDNEFQSCGIIRCLDGIVDDLPQSLKRSMELSELGIRHSLYGVKPAQYTITGQVLIEIMPLVRPNSIQARAWSCFFDHLSVALHSELSDSDSSSEFPDPENDGRQSPEHSNCE